MGIEMFEEPYYFRWIRFVREALSCLDFKTEQWVHLPNDGGLYDQDPLLMAIWEMIRYKFIELRNDASFQKQLESRRAAKAKHKIG